MDKCIQNWTSLYICIHKKPQWYFTDILHTVTFGYTQLHLCHSHHLQHHRIPAWIPEYTLCNITTYDQGLPWYMLYGLATGSQYGITTGSTSILIYYKHNKQDLTVHSNSTSLNPYMAVFFTQQIIVYVKGNNMPVHEITLYVITLSTHTNNIPC